VGLLRRESATERHRWLGALARALRSPGRERRPPNPPRWRYAVVLGGNVIQQYRCMGADDTAYPAPLEPFIFTRQPIPGGA